MTLRDFLKNSEFAKKVIDEVSHLSLKKLKKKEYASRKKYILSVFEALTQIYDTLEDLEHSLFFLGRFPYRKSLIKNGITRTKYIKYHIEVYYIKLDSILGKTNILLNNVYDFGIDSKDCHIGSLKNKNELRDTKLLKMIETLDNWLKQNSKKIRNDIAHEKKFNEADFYKFSTYDFLLYAQEIETTLKLTKEEKRAYDLLSRIYSRNYISKKRRDFRKQLENLYSFLISVFSELEKKYDEKK